MSMIFCESLFEIITSRLLALRLSCRITLYGLPSPMEAIWISRIRNTHFRWCLSVKFMTGLAGGVVSLIVVFTMFAYVLLFCISLSFFEFLLFLCNGIFPHRAEGGKCSMEVLPGRTFYTSLFDCMAVSVSVADLVRTRYRWFDLLCSH